LVDLLASQARVLNMQRHLAADLSTKNIWI
jgi:hypothetical protein